MINGYSILNGAKYFVENESSNYLVFQLVFRYFEIPANNNMAMVLKFKSLSDEVIKPLATSDNSINIKNLDPNKIKIDEKLYKNILIDHTQSVTVQRLGYAAINI